jgi:frataxin-like iron-binding protein CyaY
LFVLKSNAKRSVPQLPAVKALASLENRADWLLKPSLSGKVWMGLLFLLLSTWAHAQSATDSAGIYSKDTVVNPTSEKFDVTGKKMNIDSNVVVGADNIIPGKDTIPVVKKHSPAKAVWMSAVLPGLGQAYNKKYWKIPIIYAGLGGLGYWIYFESHEFNLARTSYRAAVRNPPYYTSTYKGREADATTIKTYRDYYKGLLNYAALATVLWYGLNLIDAAVDAHLYHFNVDEKLSFNFDPSFMLPINLGVNQTCMGLTMKIIPLNGKKKTPQPFQFQ